MSRAVDGPSLPMMNYGASRICKRACTAAAALLLVTATDHLMGAEATYPQDSPQFSIEVPQGFKPVYRDDSLVLLPIPEDGFLIQINQQPAAAAEALPKITEAIATQLKLTDLKLGTPSEAENQHEVECTVMTSTGNADGAPIVVTVVAFSIEDEKHFTVQSVGAADLNKKHSFQLLNVVDSIKPVESE